MADDHWLRTEGDDGEGAPARTAAGVMVLLLAVFAAATIPGTPAGLGLSLVAAGVAVAVALARPVSIDPGAVVLGGLGLALAAMATIRAASWVVALDLLAAVGLATVVATGAMRWREVFAAPLAVLAPIRGAIDFVFGPLRRRRRPGRLVPAFRGAAIALAMVLVFGTLFATADRAFAQLAEDLLVPDWDLSLLPARVVVFAVVLVGTAALARRAATPVVRVQDGGTREVPHGLARTEWTISLTVLDLLFAAFVAVQVAVLFGGREHVLSTSGLTYAEYARQGFFQLLAVGALTLGVVAGAVRWARRTSPGDERRLQVLLGALCVLTLVVLASAFRRLSLYESVFGYTQLRISVHGTIIWMAALFVLVLVAGLRMRASWLPRAALILTAVSLLAFSLLNPDRWIAERNVDRYTATGVIDLRYVASLSPDAAPALVRLPYPLRECALREIEADVRAPDPLLGWNLGRERARAVLPDSSCSGLLFSLVADG